MRIAAIALSAALALVAVAPALADAIMSPGGWGYRVAPTGTVFFDCHVKSCGERSLVSYHRQQDGPLSSDESFRAKQKEAQRRMIELSRGGIAEIRPLDFSAKTEKAYRVHSLVSVMVKPQGPSEYIANAEVSDGRLHYTVVSTAATEPAARANLQIFIPLALMTAMLNERVGTRSAGARPGIH